MIIAPVVVMRTDISVKPEVNQLELTKGKFHCDRGQEIHPPPPACFEGIESEETLFRLLLETIEKDRVKTPKDTFRSTTDPRLD